MNIATAIICVLPVIVAMTSGASGQVLLNTFTNFEGAQTNPIRLSPDGSRLFAVNTPNASVPVFSTNPLSLLAEIPVGIEPISVYARTNDEAWVVNQESDSISIISVSRKIVVDTIQVKDEPADVVMAAGNRAFVSAGRSNEVRVFDTTTHQSVKTIPLFDNNLQAMVVSPDGKTLYVAFAISGNRTTVVPTALSPPQPPPTNPALPAPPQVALIIDAADPNWSSIVRYKLPDNDVAAIDTAGMIVSRYYSNVGTLNLGVAMMTNGDLYVSNIDSRNLVFYEPVLRGHVVNNRVTRIKTDGTVTTFDLNPTIDYKSFW